MIARRLARAAQLFAAVCAAAAASAQPPGDQPYAEQSAPADEARSLDDRSLDDRVAELVAGLDADDAPTRSAAEAALAGLAGPYGRDADKVLAALPREGDRLPPAVRAGLLRVRRRIEELAARSATEASRVTLADKPRPLGELLDAIGEQTGNRLRDDRENFGAAPDSPGEVRVAASDEPFWPVVDRLLDEAGLTVYPFGGEGELALVARDRGVTPRVGAAAYSGPFRFEPLRVVATRNLRNPTQQSLDVELEVSWEPRLRPIVISQPLADLRMASDAGPPLSLVRPEQVITVEATPGAQAAEIVVSLLLPSRKTKTITSLAGTLRAMLPEREAEFRFDAIGAAVGRAEERGDARVTLRRFRKAGAVWELEMLYELRRAGDALASHRGWVFQNPSYLLGPDGRRYDHAGFETIVQTPTEIGLAFLFDLSDEERGGEEADAAQLDPRKMTWVYLAPSGVVTIPLPWELKDIALP